MASSNEMLYRLNDDITKCPICTQSFREPKLLPCIHTFCLHCLQEYCDRKDPGDTINCPLCNQKFKVPLGGFKELPNNYFIVQLQLNRSPDGPEAKTRFLGCDVCKNMLSYSSAVSFCIDCRKNVCESCHGIHRTIMSSSKHTLANIKYRTGVFKTAPNHCEQHPCREREFHCYTCKKTVCVVCYMNDRRNRHRCCEMKLAAGPLRTDLKKDVNRIKASASQNRKELKQLDTEISRFVANVDAVRSEIEQRCDQLRDLVDERQSQLMKEVKFFQEKRLKEFERRKYELEKHFLIMDSFRRYCEAVRESGTSLDVSRDADDLHARADELVNSGEEMGSSHHRSLDIVFESSSFTKDSFNDCIGKLSYAHTTISNNAGRESPRNATVFLHPSTVHHIVDNPLGCCGRRRFITVLGNEVFIGSENNAPIEVYDSKNITLTRQLQIPGQLAMSAFVACSHHNCLYWINDARKSVLSRFDLVNNSISKWLLNGLCCALSITKNNNILATLSNRKRLREYATNGSLIREIIFKDDEPYCSVQLSSGNFVVSLIGCQQRVCVVDPYGDIIHSYGKNAGFHEDRLNNPCQLTVDNDDNVIVADHGNSRLVLFSPTLRRLCYIDTPGYTLRYPWAVHMDIDNYCLYVGEECSGQVIVLRADLKSGVCTLGKSTAAVK